MHDDIFFSQYSRLLKNIRHAFFLNIAWRHVNVIKCDVRTRTPNFDTFIYVFFCSFGKTKNMCPIFSIIWPTLNGIYLFLPSHQSLGRWCVAIATRVSFERVGRGRVVRPPACRRNLFIHLSRLLHVRVIDMMTDWQTRARPRSNIC